MPSSPTPTPPSEHPVLPVLPPFNHTRVVVLNDGETWTDVKGVVVGDIHNDDLDKDLIKGAFHVDPIPVTTLLDTHHLVHRPLPKEAAASRDFELDEDPGLVEAFDFILNVQMMPPFLAARAVANMLRRIRARAYQAGCDAVQSEVLKGVESIIARSKRSPR